MFHEWSFGIQLQMAKEVATSSGSSRPVLKGRHMAWAKKHLFIAIAVGFGGVIAAKLLINEPRKKAYAEYYK